ncbi:hypothetical protein OAF54_03245 [bacterium]|nr:hypothetical protein [bacterium]
MIYQEINSSDFQTAFHNMGRGDQFSYEGLKALYNHLEEMNEGESMELDVIALCCEYSEYDSFYDLQQDYSDIETWGDIESKTTVIYVPNSDKFIIGQY